MTITLRYNLEHDAYVCECGFNDRHAPKDAGFTWTKIVEKKWATRDEAKAMQLAQYADEPTKHRLRGVQQAREQAVSMSRASTIDAEFDKPEGLDYLPYQKVGIAYQLGRPGTLLADEMGLGKTIQTIGLINNDPSIKKVLIVCPASLKLNWKRELEKWLTRPMTIEIVTPEGVPDADILIVNYDILHRFDFNEMEWDLVAADEVHYCFPYQTNVLTLDGWCSIGDIVHDTRPCYVASFNSLHNVLEYKEVTQRYKTPAPNTMVKVVHTNGEFICTPDHKVWVEGTREYVKAICLHSGASLRMVRENIHDQTTRADDNGEILQQQLRYSVEGPATRIQGKDKPCQPEAIDYESLRVVRERIPVQIAGGNQRPAAFLSEQLRSIMAANTARCTVPYQEDTGGCCHQEQGEQATGCGQADEREQSNEQPRDGGQGEQGYEWAHLSGEGWQRADNHTPTTTAGHTVMAYGMDGVCDTDSAGRESIPQPTTLLQGGHCAPSEQDGHRDRRAHAHQQEVEVSGQAQDGSFSFSRVVSVTLLEQGGHGESASGSTEDYVYDLQVADNHNFFIDNGVLVSNCKNPKARRSKALHAITDTKRRVAMTGTPIVNRPAELFPILHWVDPVTWPKFWPYAQRYCDAKQGKYGWELGGASNLPELQQKLRETVMIRRMKADVLKELPPKRRSVVVIPSNGSAALLKREQEAYDRHQAAIAEARAQKDLAQASDNKEAYAQAVARLRAITGVMLQDISRLRHETAVAKAPHVAEHVLNILEDNDGYKVIVFCHHKDVVDLLMDKLSAYKPVKVTGDVSMTARQAAVDAFQNDPGVQVFVGNIQAAGVGLTLTASSHVVFAELDWVPGNVSQCEDRAHRIGQHESVLIEHLVFDNSLDAKMAQTIIKKQAIIEQALDKQADADEIATIDEEVSLTHSKQREEVSLSQAQTRAVHEAMRILAGSDADHAAQANGVGFDRYSSTIGHSLADAYTLTPKQAQLGYKLSKRFRGQLPQRIREVLSL